MRVRSTPFLLILQLCAAIFFGAIDAQAQTELAVKSGESIDLGSVYWVMQCRSIMTALPEVDILEGPAEVTLTIKEAMVLPRRYGCANLVPGGTVTLTAGPISESAEAKLIYRVRYKTRDGDRQLAHTYRVLLYP